MPRIQYFLIFGTTTKNKNTMKVKELLGILMLFLCTGSLTSCDNENEDGRKVTAYKEYVLIVASREIPGICWSNGANYLSDVYAVKKEQANEWDCLGFIDGFEFEEGHEHRIRISETSYLDHRMGDPAWTEYDLLEVISKAPKESENLPSHLIPEWYYKDRFIPEYRYAVEADNKELIEQDLQENAILPSKSHYLIYGTGGSSTKWIIIDPENNTRGKGVLKRVNKHYEEFPESYKLLPLGKKIYGYMEWIFLNEPGNEAIYPPFDAFLAGNPEARSEYVPQLTPYLYNDLTDHYRSKYPDAGVKTVVVSFAIPVR